MHSFFLILVRTLKKMEKILFLSLLTLVSSQELISPCPRLFKYEPRNPNEPDKWYAQATFIAESDLTGVWIRMLFDKPSIQLGVIIFLNTFSIIRTNFLALLKTFLYVISSKLLLNFALSYSS